MLFLLMCLVINQTIAQRRIKEIDPQREEQKADAKKYNTIDWSEKLLYGGNAWMGISSMGSVVMLQPQVGYKLNERALIGTGLTYIYMNQKITYSNNTFDFKEHILGINLFSRFKIFNPVFAHVEYMPMNFNSFNALGERKRIWSNSLYLGGGINQSDDNSGVYIMLLYDILWRNYTTYDPTSFSRSFYNTPWDIRIGMFF